MRHRWLALGLLLFPTAAWGQAAQLTTSYQKIVDGWEYKSYQMIRCDNSGSLTESGGAANGPVGGESCEAGDWTRPLDCRDMTTVTISYFKYGTGTGEAKLWNCLPPVGIGTGTVAAPGVEDPTSAPGASDPDPLCVDLTAGAGVTMIGTTAGVQQFTLSNTTLGFLFGEIQACTGNCDGVLYLSCSR